MVSTTVERVNGARSSLAIKAPCAVATTADITLNGEQTVDGVAVVSGDRVLVKDQTDQTENGIYVADTGDWERAPDFDGNNDIVTGTLVRVNQGTTNAAGFFAVSTTGTITINTSNITFEEVVIDNTNATFTGQTSFPDGTAAAPSIKVGDEQNGLYSSAANTLTVATNGVFNTSFTMDGSGNKTVAVAGASGAYCTFVASNSSDTASSTAVFQAAVGGSSAGDPYSRYAIGSTASFATGVDNSDSDTFKVSYAASGTAVLGTNDYFKISTADAITLNASSAGTLTINAETISKPNIPCFLALPSAEQTNVTGNGAVATVAWGTEVFDQSGDFASNTFTAPATGKYLLNTSVRYDEGSTAMITVTLILVTSNRSYTFVRLHPAAAGPSQDTLQMSQIVDMDAADTATVTLTISGGAGDTADVQVTSFFSGMRVA